MKIEKSIANEKTLYELTFSRRDFDNLCSGCSDGGFIFGRFHDAYFHVFPGIKFSDAWRLKSDGYFFSLGVKAMVPQPNATAEEWDRAAQAFYSCLERAINESGTIPIESEIFLQGERKIVNLGYVIMKVEQAPGSN